MVWLRADNIDSFGAGPSQQRAVYDGVGFVHPVQEHLGWCPAAPSPPARIREDHTQHHQALLKSIIEATACRSLNRKEIAAAIAAPNYLNQPSPWSNKC